MNRNKLKTYAPQARREFIQAVTDRAAHYGLSAKKIEPMTEKGDVALISGRSFPKAVGEKRKKLEARIQKLGFGQTMEAVAYSWFNRLVAIRFMESHGYLEHGYRVLSHSDGRSQPEILEHSAQVDLPGVDLQKVIALKLEGTKEEELYRMLLVGQCNALHKALPFLFEAIDDETELLLPDHLLHSDSLIRKLVNEIPEEDWQEVEIIGWLYQFYISERKDEVIGKVVKSDDISAATQLFTPNWIVKYLVQNSLGRQWVATYPNSPLKATMEYYIEPAEQTPEVQAKLAEITPTTLNPEELTLLDPACGSGHILVEAYDLLKNIYQERGYRAKDIPRLILEKNLFGLEIDDRAAQLTAFALMMKARADDRSIFERGVQPHVLAIQESKGLDAKEITEALNQPILKEELPPSGELFEEIADARSPLFSKKSMGVKGAVSQADVAHLISLFEHGKTFGSLIQVPEQLAGELPAISERVNVALQGDLFAQRAARLMKPLLLQGQLLTSRYDVVATNPPYMGWNYMVPPLKKLAAHFYARSQKDTYGMFLERSLSLAKSLGMASLVSMQGWLFQSTYYDLRHYVLSHKTICTMAHLGARAFSEISGEVVQTAAYVVLNERVSRFQPSFFRLTEGDEAAKRHRLVNKQTLTSLYTQEDFLLIRGCPVAYWLSPQMYKVLRGDRSLEDIADAKKGFDTGDNNRFLRFWFEPDVRRVCFPKQHGDGGAQKRWFACSKGGAFRRWYGNNEYVFDWANDGAEMKARKNSAVRNEKYYFRPGITWSDIATGPFSARKMDAGYGFDVSGPAMFPRSEKQAAVLLGFANSKVMQEILNVTMQGMHYSCGVVAQVPYVEVSSPDEVTAAVTQLVAYARDDWDEAETSWDFAAFPLCNGRMTIQEAWQAYNTMSCVRVESMAELEKQINESAIRSYGLEDELSPEVIHEQITVYRPKCEEDIKRLISYSLGCMMGRYSLDEAGLIYAHSGNQGFDPSKFRKFPADEYGIIPLTDFSWFPDDAASHFEKFIATAWPAETLEENLTFVAESLGPKKGETSRDTIRRHLANDFYKHHLSMYKKRPIYWLFSSGKQRGFQALVYLHRYNEGTLARMRTEYVIPLLGKMTARIAHLTDDSAAATSSQHKKRLETEKATITKQLAEVQAFDEQLRHFADQRIKLDLDDGVKVNYGKFGDLLAEVKAVCGTKNEE